MNMKFSTARQVALTVKAGQRGLSVSRGNTLDFLTRERADT